MVTKTKEPVSEGPPAASEGQPPASEPAQQQEPVGALQEPGQEPGGNALDKWLEAQPPEMRAALSDHFATRDWDKSDQAKEARKRADQRGFDQGQERSKAKDRAEREAKALTEDHTKAKEALRSYVGGENVNADEAVRLSDRAAQAAAVAEHIPQLRREYREARDELPYADGWTEAEMVAFSERGPTGRREGANVLRTVHDVAWRQATEEADARWQTKLDTAVSAATAVSQRGPVPPNLGAGAGLPAAGTDAERVARIASGTGTQEDADWFNETYRGQRPAPRGA